METKKSNAAAKEPKSIAEILETITRPGRSPQMIGKDVKALLLFSEADVSSYFRGLSGTQEQKILNTIQNFPNLLKILRG